MGDVADPGVGCVVMYDKRVLCNYSNGPVRSMGVVDLTVPDGGTTDEDCSRPERYGSPLLGGFAFHFEISLSCLRMHGHRAEYQSMISCTLGVYFGEKLLRLELPLDTTLTDVSCHQQSLIGLPATCVCACVCVWFE